MILESLFHPLVGNPVKFLGNSDTFTIGHGLIISEQSSELEELIFTQISVMIGICLLKHLSKLFHHFWRTVRLFHFVSDGLREITLSCLMHQVGNLIDVLHFLGYNESVDHRV